MRAPSISLRCVTKRYDGLGGLQDVSFDVGEGESAVVFGPSGSGKTTLLRLIAGLELPDSGEVWLSGTQVAGAHRNIVAAHARGVGFVFQDLALWPHLTVQGNLEFVIDSSMIPRRERAERIQETLRLCRIDRALDRYPHQLSGGEQQRLALARALVGSPRLLMLDEPFSSLDHELHVSLRGELATLQRQLRVTTMYVTHDAEDAAVLGERTITMRAGRVADIQERAAGAEPPSV